MTVPSLYRSNNTLFDHSPKVVYTPLFDTEEELDAALARVYLYDEECGGHKRIGQFQFMNQAGRKTPIGMREYRNDVLLDTEKRKVIQAPEGPKYCAYFKTVSTGRDSWCIERERGAGLNHGGEQEFRYTYS